MGWEKRRGRDYYYRTARVDGRPRRVYLGGGALGRLHEQLDADARRAREAAAAARRGVRRRLDECDRLWGETWGRVRGLAHAVLAAAGWYNHRGQWRKVMGKPRTRKSKPTPAAPAEAADLRARLADLTAKASAGDDAALADLRAFLDEHPEVWRQVGDLTRLSVRCWTGLLSGGSALQRESVARFVLDWKGQLAGPAPTPVEEALADTAAVARLAVAHAELSAATASESLDAAAFKVKRLDAAVRRLNATLKLLVMVRAAHPQGLVPSTPSTPPPAVPAAGPRLYQPPSRTLAS